MYTIGFEHASQSLHSVHESMAQVYPGGESLAPSLVSLINRGPLLNNKDDLEHIKTELLNALTAVDAKVQNLKKLTDDRAHFREEVGHYKEKISKLEGRPDPQGQQKLEENKTKLADMESKFAATETALVPELEHLDAELSNLTSEVFKKFIEVNIAHTLAFNDQLQQGLAGIPAPVLVAAAQPEAATATA